MTKPNQMSIWCTSSEEQTEYTGLAYNTQMWAFIIGTPYVPASTYKASTNGGEV
ncbi:hypothetical protein CORT_0A13080 [Candida orthopsilosis Co 90-125]|uniref:Uncharacterized protein n=1 Tax=Candida orthopsilosis (strain 90-125) TaxID=1136231 RepID=H8WXL8_CANO9|nr:hypothetical protein CORT_0A13080 [Candida orthopsilosis Co 90-125]CCG21691.1 hypothetical protein CORT_0A13080 [Candida orthopsilosis Co 90-125]